MASWVHIAPAMTAAFLASLVEAVEALTIVLAVATVRGWRPAGLGALAGLMLLALIVAAFGPLLDRVPIHLLQLVFVRTGGERGRVIVGVVRTLVRPVRA